MSERPEMQSWLRKRICAAECGDVRAAFEVLHFMARELGNIACFSSLPEMPKLRIKTLGDEAKHVAEFLYGYSEALPKPKLKMKKRK